jgi:hypothetical protein
MSRAGTRGHYMTFPRQGHRQADSACSSGSELPDPLCTAKGKSIVVASELDAVLERLLAIGAASGNRDASFAAPQPGPERDALPDRGLNARLSRTEV